MRPGIICLVLVCAACSKDLKDESAQVLASVNDYTITVGSFERSYVHELLRTGENDTEEARQRHLRDLLQDRLLYAEALRRQLDKDSVTRAYDRLLEKKAVGGRYYDRELLSILPPITDAEVRLAFAHYKQPLVVRHLFYTREDEAEAAYARLRSGRSFLEEAQDCYQTNEFDSSAGLLGQVAYFQLDDAFAEAAFAMQVGALSEPVRSRQGYHIIRVEDRLSAPILTESEFQMRKAGITSLLRLRRQRLSGDQYVRTFMAERNVEVDTGNIAALNQALRRIEYRVAGANSELLLDDSELPTVLAPRSPLARYTYAGVDYTFTAEDYFFWLPDLPFEEATKRTAVSVGRALRNEVLAKAGEEAGLAGSRVVQRDMEVERVAFVAGRIRMQGLDLALLADASMRSNKVHVDSVLFNELMDW